MVFNVGTGVGHTYLSKWKRYVSGIVTASSFVGDGSNLTNLNVSAAGWTQVDTTYAGAGLALVFTHSEIMVM